jgi:hypothetical protein
MLIAINNLIHFHERNTNYPIKNNDIKNNNFEIFWALKIIQNVSSEF